MTAAVPDRPYRRRSALASLVVSVLLNSGASAAQQNISAPLPRTDIRVEVDLVNLYVSVAGREGQASGNLKQENFRIFEDGVEQKIGHFSTEDKPFTLGLVLDRSESMTLVIRDVYNAAFHTIRASKPDDEAFIMTFNQDITLVQDFSTDREILRKRLKKVRASGFTAVYDAVYAALEHIRGGRRQKKALLVVTDGEDNRSHRSFYELLEYARTQEVIVYVVGFFGSMEFVGPPPPFRSRYMDLLAELASATGGRTYFPRSMKECEEVCIAIANELRQQYSLAYYPSNRRRDGAWRTIKVELNNLPNTKPDGLTVRARAGYYAPLRESP